MPTHWTHPHLIVRDTNHKGKGVFAQQSLKKYERLAIFGGDVMLIDEISTLPTHMQIYPLQIEERFVLHPRTAIKPESGDFFNHSCNPNAGIRGQIFLVAMRDIAAGEEITFDYAMVISQSIGSEVVFSMQCNCGALKCRGEITENDWLLPELQENYAGYFSTYLEERILKK